ncbi:MAG TPA: LamG-like jellyroll fold domain-containing protein [Planctomycetota bacterium]|nr:LamG-like jellyroll fold domain-containing protein [Planctomycetota bacterium]
MRSPPALRGLLLVASVAASTPAQTVPELVYYKFNEGTGVGGTTTNEANPGVGTPTASVAGHSLTPGLGLSGSGCLVGTTGTTNIINTGWQTAFGSSSWTIGFWCDVSAISTATLYYPFGDSTAGGFRCFFNGAAGAGNCILRGGFTDVTIPAAGVGTAHVITWVYDASIPAVKAYLDGVLVTTSNQALTVNGTAAGSLKVAGYNTSSTFGGGAKLDEFRVYNRALTAAEIAATWNIELFNANQLSVSQSGPGVGDLTIALDLVSPTAIEGWTLITFDVSGPVGTGPFFGIRPDSGTWSLLIGVPLTDSNPLHFPVPSAFGGFPNSPFVVGPGAVSFLAGLSADFSVFLLGPGFVYDSRSNVVRHLFQ